MKRPQSAGRRKFETDEQELWLDIGALDEDGALGLALPDPEPQPRMRRSGVRGLRESIDRLAPAGGTDSTAQEESPPIRPPTAPRWVSGKVSLIDSLEAMSALAHTERKTRASLEVELDDERRAEEARPTPRLSSSVVVLDVH